MKMRSRIGAFLGTAMLVIAACGLTACLQNPKYYDGADVAIDLVTVGTTILTLDQSYDSIVTIIGKPTYSDYEKQTLASAKNSVDRVRTQLRELSSKSTAETFIILTSDQTKTVYNELKDAYVKVRGVVLAHQADYSAADWAYLVQLNQTVISLDKSVANIWQAKENVNAQWQAALLAAAQAAADISRVTAYNRH